MHLAPRQLDLFRAPRPPAPAAAPVRTAVASPVEAPAPRAEARPATVAPAAPPAVSEARPVAPAPTPALPRSDAELQLSKPPPSRMETLALARVLAQRLADLVGPELKVLLSVHDNRSTMISFRRQPPLLKVRLHHMFLDAPAEIVQAVVEYAARGRHQAGQLLDDYIASKQAHIRAQRRRASTLESRGRCFDLEEIFAQLNDQHFQGGIRAAIGWGRQTPKRKRRSIRLGVYDHKSREIRIHPSLDRPDVPRYFVEFIVFHEMLHQVFPSERGGGRHVHHPRAFRDREKSFPRYELALAWEKEHLHALLKR